MAFFTRVNLNVPVLPPEELIFERNSVPGYDHRRYASEPVKTNSSRGIMIHNRINRKCNGPSTATIIKVSAPISTSITTSGNRGSKILEESTEVEPPLIDSQKVLEEQEGEPKRYEYVVDRVLGVEV
jgi:hypothetical protein